MKDCIKMDFLGHCKDKIKMDNGLDEMKCKTFIKNKINIVLNETFFSRNRNLSLVKILPDVELQ
jgi:hypothetical protein